MPAKVSQRSVFVTLHGKFPCFHVLIGRCHFERTLDSASSASAEFTSIQIRNWPYLVKSVSKLPCEFCSIKRLAFAVIVAPEVRIPEDERRRGIDRALVSCTSGKEGGMGK